MRLAYQTGEFQDFMFNVALVEPLFQLETQAKALDDSHSEKSLFLALVTLARTEQISEIVTRVQDASKASCGCFRQWGQNLTEIIQSYQPQ